MMRPPGYPGSGLFGKLLALAAGAMLLALGLLFSVLILPLIAVLVLAVWAYFRWKTRKLRQAMKEHGSYGQVIEGEAVVVDEFEEAAGPGVLPRDPPQ